MCLFWICSCNINQSTCALANDGTIWATGLNSSGQLGLGNNTNVNSFTQIGSSKWRAVSNGYTHCLAIPTDSSLWV